MSTLNSNYNLSKTFQTIQHQGSPQCEVNLSGLKIELSLSSPAVGRIHLTFDDIRDFYLKLLPSSNDCKAIFYGDRSVQITFVEDAARIVEKMNQFLAQIDLLFADGVVRKLIETNNDSRFTLPSHGYSNPPSSPVETPPVRRTLFIDEL